MKAHDVLEQIFTEFFQTYGMGDIKSFGQNPPWKMAFLNISNNEVDFFGSIVLSVDLPDICSLALYYFGTYFETRIHEKGKISLDEIAHFQTMYISCFGGRRMALHTHRNGLDLSKPYGRFAAKIIARAVELAGTVEK